MNYTDGYTKVCGLIGNPVKHTLSPLIHNYLSNMLGVNLIYVPFEVKDGGIKAAIKGAAALDIRGLNVTVPYKSDVIPFLEDIDSLAKAIGAVNTLVRTENGGFKGYNTDMTGLFHAMQDEDIDIRERTVVILGAGGVARPAAFLCASKGAKKVYILNRTFEKAKEVAEDVSNEIEDSERSIIPMRLANYKELYKENEKFIALQCTSVGLFPDVNSAVIEDAEFYEHVSCAIDVVYRPIETKFMKLAKAAGAKTYSGLKMLLYQGIDAFELWNSDLDVKVTKEQADTVYRSLVLEVIGARNIILEGFMGSGKSTVSDILARKLELELIDTDRVIEENEGCTINEIFERDGEETFRELETDLLSVISDDSFRECVISLGGGMPERERNRELLKMAGKVVFLRTKPETIYERLKGDTTRPLLAGDNPIIKIKELMSRRAEFYQAAADLVIDTDAKTPEEVADAIIKELGIR